MAKKVKIQPQQEECNSCKRDKEKIMNALPWLKRATRRIDETEFNIFNNFTSGEELTILFNEIFNDSVQICNCHDIHKEMIERLQILQQIQDK